MVSNLSVATAAPVRRVANPPHNRAGLLGGEFRAERLCLKCRRVFESKSRWHRLCPRCRHSNASVGRS